MKRSLHSTPHSHSPSKALPTVCTLVALLVGLPEATAQLRALSNFAPVYQYGNDDDSTDPVSLGFSINLFGADYTDLFINNNGNVTFAFPSGLGNPSSIPDGFAQQGGPVLAPFFADVDTTYTAGLSYGTGTIAGHDAFVVNWMDVAAFGSGLQPTNLNTFQLFIVDRSDTGLGNFDFEFNYAKIEWDHGANSVGISALVGFSDAVSVNYLLPGSGVADSFLDSASDGGLVSNHLGTPFDGAVLDGRYAFNVRDGAVTFVPGGDTGPGDGGGNNVPVPEPSTYGLLGAVGLVGIAFAKRKSRRKLVPAQTQAS